MINLRVIPGVPVVIGLLALIAGCGGGNSLNTSSSTDMDSFNSSFSQNQQKLPSSTASTFWDIQRLKGAPRIEKLAESTEKSTSGDLVVRELKYDCPGSSGENLNIFAYYAYPARKQNAKLPAIIIVHGGTGLADRAAVIDWASRGYAALAMDLPGKGHGRDKSRSDGPPMDDDITFKVTPSPKSSYLYPAVNSVCRAISLLSTFKEVDTARIGLIGSSWGGVIAYIVNGIDDRVSAACSVWAAGCIPDESCWVKDWIKKLPASGIRTWRKYYDPLSYASNQHGKLFLVTATQDAYFPLRSWVKTCKSAAGEKAMALTLNKSHDMDDACRNDIVKWFDWALRSGPALPSIKVTKHGENLNVTAKGPNPVVKAELVTADGTDYFKAKWTGKEIEGKDGAWAVKAPAADVPYFINIRDDSGAVVASDVYLPPTKK